MDVNSNINVKTTGAAILRIVYTSSAASDDNRTGGTPVRFKFERNPSVSRLLLPIVNCDVIDRPSLSVFPGRGYGSCFAIRGHDGPRGRRRFPTHVLHILIGAVVDPPVHPGGVCIRCALDFGSLAVEHRRLFCVERLALGIHAVNGRLHAATRHGFVLDSLTLRREIGRVVLGLGEVELPGSDPRILRQRRRWNGDGQHRREYE